MSLQSYYLRLGGQWVEKPRVATINHSLNMVKPDNNQRSCVNSTPEVMWIVCQNFKLPLRVC